MGTSSSLPSTVSYNAAVEESQQLTLLEMYMLNSDGDMETLLEIYLKDVQSEVWCHELFFTPSSSEVDMTVLALLSVLSTQKPKKKSYLLVMLLGVTMLLCYECIPFLSLWTPIATNITNSTSIQILWRQSWWAFLPLRVSPYPSRIHV